MNVEIQSTLEAIGEEKGIVDSFVVKPWKPSEGQGYLADINLVYVEGKSKNGTRIVLSFVVKVAATNEKLRKSTCVPLVFGREIFMYDSVFREYYDFEKEKGILNPFGGVAKCYRVFSKTVPEILILENLNHNGYRIWNRKNQMDDAHVKLVMEEYGRFHAVSFALQDQKPDVFRKLTKNIDNVYDIFMETSGLFYTYVKKVQESLSVLNPKVDQDAFRRYSAFLDSVQDTYKDLITCKEKHFSILHGDCWSNNILIKYDNLKNPQQPTGIRLIDFQLSRLGSPAYDLAYFFYPCVLQDVLKNVKIYKRIYYDSFAAHVKRLGSDPEVVYPFSVFDEHWRKYSKFGLVISSLLNFVLLSEKNEITDFTTIIESGRSLTDAFNYEIANQAKYNERMRNIIYHCIENNYI